MSVTQETGRRMDQLERAVVFRTARGSFFLMAVLAVLTFAAGVVLGTLGYIKMPISRPPAPAPIAEVTPPPPLTYQQVEAWLAAEEARKQAARAAPAPRTVYDDDEDGPAPARTDPLAEELRALDAQLRALFPNPPYVWDDVHETTCTNLTAYGCLREERRVKTEGLARAVRAVLAGTSRAEKAATLRLLVDVLGQAPVERRGALLGPIIAVNDEVMRDYRQQVAARDGQVEEQEHAFRAAMRRYEARIAKRTRDKAEQRRYGRYAIAGGLALLVLVSVFLVHFAMERHLRLMRDLIDVQRRAGTPLGASASSDSPPAPVATSGGDQPTA